MKTAIVTGGSAGIGRSTARHLAGAGCRVFELSRHGESAGGVEHISCDVTDEAAVRAAIDECLRRSGRIDILVCNAGFGISGSAEHTSAADAHAQLELNLFGTDNAVRAVLPHMRAAGGGRIVCMSSIAGHTAHTLPALVLRQQGGDRRLRAGAPERGAALQNKRLRRTARRH